MTQKIEKHRPSNAYNSPYVHVSNCTIHSRIKMVLYRDGYNCIIC